MGENTQSWAVYDGNGCLRYVGRHTNEADVWQIFLGWPAAEEIRQVKASGTYATKVRIVPLGWKGTVAS